MRTRNRTRVVPAVVGTAVAVTLAADVAVIASGRLEDGGRPGAGNLVSVAGDAAPPVPVVAPLTRRYTPHLLIAGTVPLPPAAVERARRMRGVAGVTVVDAARAQVGGRRVGLLGVDPSAFRAFAPRETAESDQLWRMVATGGLAVSFDLGRDGSLPLGEVVPAGSRAHPGQVRVGAYASMGIGDVDAVVSRAQARTLGMPDGNGLVLSAPRTDAGKLAKRLKKILPRGTKVAALGPSVPAGNAVPKGRPRVTGRPDGTPGGRTPITGNMMTPTMRTMLLEVDGMFGPFPTIGCYRAGDPQDHGDGRACDFMESTAGLMPTPSAQRHGDQVAQYAISNARRLGISYVIWRQHIWNARGGGWRPMADRGSLTQNHHDHVHISVLR
ncbi:hypothetical protein [Actinomadura rubrisoli]|uniref:ARB-07466-like C-terminal domain-containing protein n=1 Tax=Actinomadura rubrisoli TaxID=2530368 RepID=A0A4R5C9V1_9ACTN|nr:hypothetical protein [Actinomadura rubrisoli]TDD96075.1 hypothetical protein E1298_03785 [Actinomadura rubrisoli]